MHYTPPFRITYRYDCNFKEYADTIEEAVEIGLKKHPESMICVHGEATYNGYTQEAHVGIYAKDAEGKSKGEIMELFDQKIENYIACRVRTGLWGIV